jgi:hypothetical protein
MMFAVMFLFSVASSIATGSESISVVTSDVEASKDGDREKWWDVNWHYRLFITVNSTGHDRRKGDSIEYKLGLDNVTDLDNNSIRLFHGGIEIPSEYDESTDTLVWTLDGTIRSGNSRRYTVYYDTSTNGLKMFPDYGIDWFTNTTDSIMDMWQGYNESYQAYLDGYQIKNVSGAYVLRGEPVYESNGNWYYSNGTEANYYIVGDGEFYWYNDQEIYADDQGNWYYKNGSMLTLGLYFNEGRYTYQAPGWGLIEAYNIDGAWYADNIAENGRYNLITIDPVTNYYTTLLFSIFTETGFYYTTIYQDYYTKMWYYVNNSVVEGYYDPVTRDFYYDGNRVFEQSPDEWAYYNGDGDLVSFASSASDMYFYKDQMVFKNATGYWVYMNGTDVVGSIYENNGSWYLYVKDDLEVVYLDNKTLIHDGEFIYYNTVEGKWYYSNGTEYTGSIDDTQNVYIYDGNTVYEINGTWYYDNGTTMVGYVYDEGGKYYVYHDGILAYFYEDPITGIVYYWNGTEYHQYGPFGQDGLDGQDFYLGSSFTNELLDAVMVGNNLWIDDYKIGNVKAVLSGKADVTDGGTTHEESSSVIMYRGSNQFTVKLMNNAPEQKSAWGSIIFNLNGSIKSGGSSYTPDNYTIFLDQIKDDFGFDIQTWIESAINDVNIDLSGANRYIVLAEDSLINIDSIDWATQGVVVADSTFNHWNSKSYGPGESLTIAPILLNTRYLGVYDIVDQTGVALGFDKTTPFSNMLLEVIKEVDNGGVNYLLNASLNYVDWWYNNYGEAGLENLLHAWNDGNIEVVWTYLNSDIDPIEALENIVFIHGSMTTEELNRDPSIPIDVILHSPVPGQVVTEASDLIINVTVTGETLSHAKYYLDVDGVMMDFNKWNEIIIGNGNTKHVGRRMSAVRRIQGINRATINIIAYDTNGLVTLASADIIVDGKIVDEVIWTITIGSIGAILALLGLASISNKKNRAGCIGGACNIK